MSNRIIKKNKDRVCIIFPGNVFTTPFLKRYTNILEEKSIKYDLVYWDAAGVDEITGAIESYILPFKLTPLDSHIRKLIGYFRFFMLASKTIKSFQYKSVICLTSIPAVMLCHDLIKRYDGKYIVDIRDFFMEDNQLYFKREKKAIEHSAISVISSPGYKEFLPNYMYTISHNINWINKDDLQRMNNVPKKKTKTIQLSYIGNMRFIDCDKQILSFFANDDRFHINLIGKGYSTLQQFCDENGITNVSIIDWFPPEKTLDYYEKADIVLNLYGNGSPTVDYALSNKLYYAAQLRKPILVCPNTYMEKISMQYGFGYVFDYNIENIKDKLYYYYNSIEWNIFNDNCARFLDDIKKDDDTFIKNVMNFLEN